MLLTTEPSLQPLLQTFLCGDHRVLPRLTRDTQETHVLPKGRELQNRPQRVQKDYTLVPDSCEYTARPRAGAGGSRMADFFKRIMVLECRTRLKENFGKARGWVVDTCFP